jgi:glycosyltransferase involved in cell wall biosynthesis
MGISKLLTIIIPVYKVEKYIRQCLDSVLVPQEQMGLLEVIVVNDGTPDNSAVIARQYETQYPDTIKVIDKENGGHGSAWNAGLKLATGKYTRFLDSDDWLSDLSGFISRIETLDVDIIITHQTKYDDITGTQDIVCCPEIEYDKVLSIDSLSYSVTAKTIDFFNFHRCTYRTSMLRENHPLFCERVYYDDGILFLAPLILGKTLIYLDRTLYIYRHSREGQTMDSTVEKTHAYDYIPVCIGMIDFVNRHPDISEAQRRIRDKILQAYMGYRFLTFTSLPFKEYRMVMKNWFPVLKDIPDYDYPPKILLYKYTTPFISWKLIRLFDKYCKKGH